MNKNSGFLLYPSLLVLPSSLLALREAWTMTASLPSVKLWVQADFVAAFLSLTGFPLTYFWILFSTE